MRRAGFGFLSGRGATTPLSPGRSAERLSGRETGAVPVESQTGGEWPPPRKKGGAALDAPQEIILISASVFANCRLFQFIRGFVLFGHLTPVDTRVPEEESKNRRAWYARFHAIAPGRGERGLIIFS